MPGRAINWFKGSSSVPKLVIGVLVLLVLLFLLSPVLRVVAVLAFLVSLAVLVVRAVRRGPIRTPGIATVASLILIPLLGGLSGAIYGGGGDGFFGASLGSSGGSQYDTPEEKVSAALAYAWQDWQVRNVEVEGSASSGYSVDVDFDARCSSCSDAGFVRAIENDVASGYEALFTSGMAPDISNASVAAYHSMISEEDGSESDEVIFSTSMDGLAGRDINWSNSDYVNFTNVWEVEDIHVNYDPLWTSGAAFERYEEDF